MTWFKVDDGLLDHPKMLALQSHKGWQGALSLWTLAGAWVSRQLTDGFVPNAIVPRLGCAKKDADLLVTAGFWDVADGGYSFHDWHACNPSRDTVEAKREKTRKKVSDWRSNRVTEQVTNPAPVPSRPVPSNSPLTPEGAGAEPDEPRDPAPRAAPDGSAQFEVLEVFRGTYPGKMPRLYGQVSANAIEHCRELAAHHRRPLDQVARDVCLAAGPNTPNWAHNLARVDPYATAGPTPQELEYARRHPTRTLDQASYK